MRADDGGLGAFKAMVEKSKSGDWQNLLTLTQQAMESFPGWFTPRLFLGQAQIRLCKKEEAIKSLNQFLSDTDGATAYAAMRSDAQRWLSEMQSDQYATMCPVQSGAPK